MLSILLLILKIILYVILALLCLIILILLIVLFSKFEYAVLVDKPSGFKDTTTLKADVSCSWLCKILKVDFKFKNNKSKLLIRIFNIPIGNNKKKKKKKNTSQKKTKTNKEIKIEEKEEKEKKKQEKLEKKKEKQAEKEKNKDKNKIDVLSYLKDMYFIRSVCRTLKNVLKIVLPKDFSLKGVVGLPDPALTAYISGFTYALFKPLSKNIFIDSNFEEEVIIINCNIHGKFKISTILRQFVWFLEYELNKRKFFGKRAIIKLIILLKP